MRSLVLALFSLSILSGVFLFAPSADAQGLPSFTGHIVPCGQSCDAGEGATGIRECTTCHLVVMVQRILTFLVFLGAVITVFMFLWSGFTFLRATGNVSVIAEAKEKFLNAMWGFIIVLAAWLIVDVVISIFYDRDRLGPWHQIVCESFDPSAPFPGAAACSPLVRPTLRGGDLNTPLPDATDPFCFTYQQPQLLGGLRTALVCRPTLIACQSAQRSIATGLTPSACAPRSTIEIETPESTAPTFGTDPELLETDDPELAARAAREVEVRDRLLDAGIDVRRGFCVDGREDVFSGDTDCVNVGELDEELLAALEAFAAECNAVTDCSLFIEIGSESGDTDRITLSDDSGGALVFQQVLDSGVLGEPVRVNEGLMTYDLYTDAEGNQYRLSADGSSLTMIRAGEAEPVQQPEPELAPITVFDPESIPEPTEPAADAGENGEQSEASPDDSDPAAELALQAQRERNTRDELEDSGIVTQQLGACTDDATADSSCTSVRDLDRNTIEAMKTFSETCTYCGGDFMVVEGSENGETQQAVLISPQGLPLRTHLDDNYEYVGDAPNGSRIYIDEEGNAYQLSNDHLEVTVLSGDAAEAVVSELPPPPASVEEQGEPEQESTCAWWNPFC